MTDRDKLRIAEAAKFDRPLTMVFLRNRDSAYLREQLKRYGRHTRTWDIGEARIISTVLDRCPCCGQKT